MTSDKTSTCNSTAKIYCITRKVGTDGEFVFSVHYEEMLTFLTEHHFSYIVINTFSLKSLSTVVVVRTNVVIGIDTKNMVSTP